jgi:hypothetical protein
LVFRVHTPPGADEDVVDVGAAVADRYGVQHLPAVLAQLLELGADGLLAAGADPPGALVGLHVEGAGQERPDPAAFPHRGQLGFGLAQAPARLAVVG